MPHEKLRAKRVASRPDEFLNGVPNRDLTEDDYDALDTDQRKAVRESGLYDVRTDAEMKPAAERAAAKGGES